MEFLFSCSTWHSTRSLRSLESYRVKHSKRNSISTRAYVLFSPHIYINFLFLSISFLFFFGYQVYFILVVYSYIDTPRPERTSLQMSGSSVINITQSWHHFPIKSAIIYRLGGGRGNRRRILERITSFSGETNGGSVSHCWHSVKEGSLKYFRNSGNFYHDTTKTLWQPPSPPPRCRCIMTSP